MSAMGLQALETPAPISSMQLRAGSQDALVQLFERGAHVQRWYGFIRGDSVIRHQSAAALVKRSLARFVGRHAHRKLRLTAKGEWYAATIRNRRAAAAAERPATSGAH